MQTPEHNYRVDLGNGYWYDNTPDYYGVNDSFIKRIEKKYNVRYIAEWPGITVEGYPTTNPKMLFWNDVEHPRGSNWMGMYEQDPYYYVCDGIGASRLPINCVVSNEKQVLFSKYRHDFRSSHDGSVSIDGGREYTRVLGNVYCERVWVVPYQGELKIIPDAMAMLMLEKHK